jgi:hypothetical protein
MHATTPQHTITQNSKRIGLVPHFTTECTHPRETRVVPHRRTLDEWLNGLIAPCITRPMRRRGRAHQRRRHGCSPGAAASGSGAASWAPPPVPWLPVASLSLPPNPLPSVVSLWARRETALVSEAGPPHNTAQGQEGMGSHRQQQMEGPSRHCTRFLRKRFGCPVSRSAALRGPLRASHQLP